MDEEIIKQLNMEVEAMSFNELNELGNRAVSLGLILGHGYRSNQYEILRKNEVVMLTPKEAAAYLKKLIGEVGG
ncbi:MULTISPECIES: hypothetical protein [unclassified Coleofasciculus]|uniref:hypothetical protein n=1 Tax=Cyanophyceae TaxID=3028117 RepID=UPI0016821F94|nr:MULTISPECIES: hypothetical protein [unclassified Coleofasciculus]MBD1877960.1 hypothetical protein [Coleofasciculus sp. FACHB-T130]MBD1945643.1 hypothetical protein [Coleofasciculus sp. FACHB-712]MBD2087195.1 hypothetical protein [Coleofasciculus sp. FACHB-542]